MKADFKEIQQFTRTPGYHAHMDWDDLIDGWIPRQRKERLNLDPIFQRGHVWSEAKRIKYIEYILRNGMTGRALYFNHPGWMTHYNGEFVLVDGKQRIKAVECFLCDEFPVFGYKFSEYKKNSRLPSQCYFDLYINDLQKPEEVMQWYLDLNEGGVVHTEKELNMVRALIASGRKSFE